MVRIRGLDAEAFAADEGVGALVVTVGDEGSYGKGINGGARDTPSHRDIDLRADGGISIQQIYIYSTI